MENITVSREDALQFVKDKEIAIAGVSRDPHKFGNIAYKTLKSKGLSIYPINPNTDKLDNAINR
jgi:predicted CoA-binding protein